MTDYTDPAQPDVDPDPEDDTEANLVQPGDLNDDGLADDTEPADVDGDEVEAQGSVDTPDGVGGEVVSVPVGGDAPPIDVPAAAYNDPGPLPVTPASSQQQYDARVKYENQVNAQFEAWMEQNKAAVLDAFLAGHSVELRRLDGNGNEVSDDDEPSDDVEIAPKA